jgi:DNA-binding PadR family transcriptional regulator
VTTVRTPADAEPVDLPGTAWALLGLLSFGREMSGYDLKKWADNSLAFFYWSPAPSQIYAELRRLERLGLTASRAEPGDNRKKRLFRITDDGAAALRTWLDESDPGVPVLKHGTAMRVWLGHLLEPERLRALVVEHRRQMAELADQAADVAARGREQGWSHPAVVIEWSSRYYAAQVELADELLVELDRLQRSN